MAIPACKSLIIETMLDDLYYEWYGRTRTGAIKLNICAVCGKAATTFRAPVNEREYTLSGHCQGCQDIAALEGERLEIT